LVGWVRAVVGSLVVATAGNTLFRLTLTDAGTPSAPGPFSVTAVQLANRALSCAGDVPMDGNRLATRFCDVRSLTFDAQGYPDTANSNRLLTWRDVIAALP